MGICGGYQMMGIEISDPDHVEGNMERLPGLGLLPVITRMEAAKVTRQVQFSYLESITLCEGYEIHNGATEVTDQSPVSPLNRLEDGTTDGYFMDSHCMGTYIHGILDNQVVIDALLAPFTDELSNVAFDYKAFKEEQYDKLAAHVRKHVNMELVYGMM
jgi:adenosylcobyric acid synthase